MSDMDGTKDRKIRTEAELRAERLAKTLRDNEEKIVAELIAVQGHRVDMGGYYRPDFAKLGPAMRPSATFNAALAAL